MKDVVYSFDAELVYAKDNEDSNNSDSDNNSVNLVLHTMTIEIKAHVAHITSHAKQHQLETNIEASKGFATYENEEPPYHEINNAVGKEFHKWIPKHKESFEPLHHVAVCNKRK